MAQIGDFVWSDGMIASIDRVREPINTGLYYFEGRSIGSYSGTNDLRRWNYFDYTTQFLSKKDDPLVTLADLEQVAKFIQDPRYKDRTEAAKPFITRLFLWCLSKEADLT